MFLSFGQTTKCSSMYGQCRLIFTLSLCTFPKLFFRSLHCVYILIVIVVSFGVGLCELLCI